jgi:cytoskeletal protein RodZ
MNSEGSISEQLRQSRQGLQKSIEEIHQQTGVSLNVLRELEEGNFEVVEPVFLRLSLRTYAEYLKLDMDAILATYDQDFASAPELSPKLAQPAPPLGISTRRRLIGLGFAGLVVLVLVAPLGNEAPEAPESATPAVQAGTESEEPANPQSLAASESSTEEKLAETSGEDAAVAARPVESPPDAPLESAAPSAPSVLPAVDHDSLLVLKIEAIDSVWVEIKGDSLVLFEETIPPGFTGAWETTGHFQVHAGRGHALRYWFQGEPLGEGGVLGTAEQVLRFRVSREGTMLLNPNFELLAPALQPQDAPSP